MLSSINFLDIANLCKYIINGIIIYKIEYKKVRYLIFKKYIVNIKKCFNI